MSTANLAIKHFFLYQNDTAKRAADLCATLFVFTPQSFESVLFSSNLEQENSPEMLQSWAAKPLQSAILQYFETQETALTLDYFIKKENIIYQLAGYNLATKIGFLWQKNPALKLPKQYYFFLQTKINTLSALKIWLAYHDLTEMYQDKINAFSVLKNETEQQDHLLFLKYEITAFLLLENQYKADEYLKNQAKKAFTLPKTEQKAAFKNIYHQYWANFYAHHHLFSQTYTACFEEQKQDLTAADWAIHYTIAEQLYQLSLFKHKMPVFARNKVNRSIGTFFADADAFAFAKRLCRLTEQYVPVDGFDDEQAEQMQAAAVKNSFVFLPPIAVVDLRLPAENEEYLTKKVVEKEIAFSLKGSRFKGENIEETAVQTIVKPLAAQIEDFVQQVFFG